MKSYLPDVDIPEITLHQFILKQAEIYGSRVALVCGETGRSYTYQQIATLSRSVSSGLFKLGVTKDTKVAILAENIPEYALFLYGTLGTMATATTINPNYTANEIANQLKLCEASFIITANGFEKQVNEAIKRIDSSQIKAKVLYGAESPGYIPFSQLLEDDGTTYPDHVTCDVRDHVAEILFSSGTTGLPKGVQLTHYNVVANITQLRQTFFPPTMKLFDKKEHEYTLGILPFFHSFGLNCILCLQLYMGCTIVTLQRFKPQLFLQTIQKYKISALTLVPPMILFLAKDPEVLNYDLSSVKTTFCGAAPLSPELTAQYKQRIPGDLTQGYGLTESSPSILGPIFIRKAAPGSAGFVLPNTEVKLVDEKGVDISEPGQRGELLARGPQMMKGYYKNKEATEATIDAEGWLHTGDVAFYDEDNNIYVVDRIKELIKYKGFQVAPAELEAVLLSHPGVSDAAVIGIPDTEAGELPRAYIVRKAGSNVTEQQIHDLFKENMAAYKQLRGGVMFVSQIPKNPSGKILRRQLRDALANNSKL